MSEPLFRASSDALVDAGIVWTITDSFYVMHYETPWLTFEYAE